MKRGVTITNFALGQADSGNSSVLSLKKRYSAFLPVTMKGDNNTCTRVNILCMPRKQPVSDIINTLECKYFVGTVIYKKERNWSCKN